MCKEVRYACHNERVADNVYKRKAPSQTIQVQRWFLSVLVGLHFCQTFPDGCPNQMLWDQFGKVRAPAQTLQAQVWFL